MRYRIEYYDLMEEPEHITLIAKNILDAIFQFYHTLGFREIIKIEKIIES